ncbi:MAG: hypothetical protein BA861_00450 [Desulfobacterales bacterium S3730MH5]|nr:MAG: hypothetical protein BA861_00450 [Desulfobacterales bacterium S3730MH5]
MKSNMFKWFLICVLLCGLFSAGCGETPQLVDSYSDATFQSDRAGVLGDRNRHGGDNRSTNQGYGNTSSLARHSRSSRASQSSGIDKGVFLTLYREQFQGAFHILIPKGWRTEGGMIPSGVGWNVVDLVENNIKFRVTSPDGKSFFGWYPRFYFQDPAAIAQSSMGVLRKQPGEVMNGCWLYPYMSIEEYVQHIVFGQLAANEFQNPRILGQAVPAPELKPWIPRAASDYQCGYVNFECSIGGTPMFGRIYPAWPAVQQCYPSDESNRSGDPNESGPDEQRYNARELQDAYWTNRDPRSHIRPDQVLAFLQLRVHRRQG